jgi:hypothetical protein
MEIKLFLTSLPLNHDVKGIPSQGYAGNHWVDSLINKVSARSISSIMGPDLRGELTHLFAPKVKRNFDGVAVGIDGNTTHIKDKYSLRNIPLKNIKFSAPLVTRIPLRKAIGPHNRFRECC